MPHRRDSVRFALLGGAGWSVKEMGSTGVKMPEIGLGAWQYRGGPSHCEEG